MDHLQKTTETETLIASHEVRELLERLTESSVEAIPAEEPRTLEGLSLNTGIPVAKLREELFGIRGRKSFPWAAIVSVVLVVAVIVAAYSAWPRPKATPSFTPTPPIVSIPSTSGLVPLTNVTYGPDSGTMLVDPSFDPTNPLPAGISVTTMVGEVLWGSGDHRADVISKPLTKQQADEVQQTIEELLQYTRERAKSRGLPLDKLRGDPKLSMDGEGYTINLMMYFYYGGGNISVHLSPAGTSDEEAAKRIKRAAKFAVDTFQGQITQFNSHRLGDGPR